MGHRRYSNKRPLGFGNRDLGQISRTGTEHGPLITVLGSIPEHWSVRTMFLIIEVQWANLQIAERVQDEMPQPPAMQAAMRAQELAYPSKCM